MSKLNVNNNYCGYKKKYGVISHVLMALDENVVSDKDYGIVKNYNINAPEGFAVFCKVLFEPWFLSFPEGKRKWFFEAVDSILLDDDGIIDAVFDHIEYVFDDKIIDKKSFLSKLGDYLKNIMVE